MSADAPSPTWQPDAMPDVATATRLKRPGRVVTAVVALIAAAILARLVVEDRHYQWSVVGHYFFSSQILRGLLVTLELTAAAMTIGIVLGMILAVARVSHNPVTSALSWLYIWFFRGTPLLVQLIFWYNFAILLPRLSIGVPFGPLLVGENTNSLITPSVAALLGLGLNEAAYMAEIVRAGFISVPPGQMDAAHALGMTGPTAFRRVTLPQAMRTIVPPTGNQVIGMLKTTSLVSVIAIPDLLYSSQLIYSRTFQTIPLLVVASLWYLLVSSLLTTGQYFVERHFGRGAGTAQTTTLKSQILAARPRMGIAAWRRS